MFKKTGVMVNNGQLINTPLILILIYDLCNLPKSVTKFSVMCICVLVEHIIIYARNKKVKECKVQD
jgi:hypothetical protein